MDIEQRFLKLHRIQLMIEFCIIFCRKFGRRFRPCRCWIVDDIIYLNRFRFCILSCIFRKRQSFFFCSKFNRNRHEFIVLGKQLANSEFFQKFFRTISNMKDYFSSAFRFVGFFQRKFRAAVTNPTHCWFVLIRFGKDFHFFCYHKRRIKSETKMADNS